ncbi:MAG: hypothetical protein R3A10_04835 [Caldilineaceae bacterium]
MIKASAGGGGKGMRRRAQSQGLRLLMRPGARRPALFGNDEVYLKSSSSTLGTSNQKYDNHGTTIHPGERECSIQRRHQKLIEEAPSVGHRRAAARRDGTGAIAAARRGLCERRHHRVSLIPLRIATTSRDEQSSPGRAPGDGDGDRR